MLSDAYIIKSKINFIYLWFCILIYLWSKGQELSIFEQKLTVKQKQIVADNILKFILFFRENKAWQSCELSALQTILKKCQALFSLKKKKKYFKVLSAAVVISA